MKTNKPRWRLVASFFFFTCAGSLPLFAQDEVAPVDDSADIPDVTLDGAASAAPVPAPAPAPAPVPVPADTATTPSSAEVATPAPEATAEQAKSVEAPEEQQQAEQQPEETAEKSEEKTEQDASASASASAPAATAEVAVTSEAEPSMSIRSGYGKRLFGSTRMQLAVGQPTFTEGPKGYDVLYGKPKAYPTITADWFPMDWWVNPGLSARVGGYSVGGMAAVKQTDGSDTIVPDTKSHTNLLFIPLQGAAKIEMTPFKRKWLVLDGWLGYEYGWWQETTAEDTDTTTTKSGSASTDSTDTSKPTSKGVKSATTFGVSANILLNGLDEGTVRSMVATTGVAYVYLTPYVEVVKSLDKSGMTFSRNVYGVGFTFETLR